MIAVAVVLSAFAYLLLGSVVSGLIARVVELENDERAMLAFFWPVIGSIFVLVKGMTRISKIVSGGK